MRPMEDINFTGDLHAFITTGVALSCCVAAWQQSRQSGKFTKYRCYKISDMCVIYEY